MPDAETLSRDLMDDVKKLEDAPSLLFPEGLAKARADHLVTIASQHLRQIVSISLGPRRWPQRGDLVVPALDAQLRVDWQGAIYKVALCQHDGYLFAGACTSCRAPIEPGDLYVPRKGSLPLCLDCVEPA